MHLKNIEKLCSWKEIAKNFEDKTQKQCMYRYRKIYKKNNVSRVKWTKEEDQKLDTLVNKYGENFHLLLEYFPLKKEKDIMNRYYKRFNKCLIYTLEEDNFLLQLYDKKDLNHSKISIIQKNDLFKEYVNLKAKSKNSLLNRIEFLVKRRGDEFDKSFNISSMLSSFDSSNLNNSSQNNLKFIKEELEEDFVIKNTNFNNTNVFLVDDEGKEEEIFYCNKYNDNILKELYKADKENSIYGGGMNQSNTNTSKIFMECDNIIDNLQFMNNTLNFNFNDSLANINENELETNNFNDFEKNFYEIFKTYDNFYNNEDDEIALFKDKNEMIVETANQNNLPHIVNCDLDLEIEGLIDKKEKMEQILSKINEISFTFCKKIEGNIESILQDNSKKETFVDLLGRLKEHEFYFISKLMNSNSNLNKQWDEKINFIVKSNYQMNQIISENNNTYNEVCSNNKTDYQNRVNRESIKNDLLFQIDIIIKLIRLTKLKMKLFKNLFS